MSAQFLKPPPAVPDRVCAYGRTGDSRIQNRFFAIFCGQNSVGLFCLLLCLVVVPLHAQTPAPQISEALADDLGQLRTLTETRSYAPALALIDRLLSTAAADSYDRTLLSQIKAQVFIAQGDYSAAIAPLETALHNGERLAHLPPAALADSLFLLAQLHQQQASESKDPAVRRIVLARAVSVLRRWQARIQKPTTDGQLFAASLFYQQATLDPDHIDLAALAEARRAAEAGLLLQTKPPASLYVLLLATLQQSADHTRAAEILELLVEKSPDNTGYWQQLVSTYLTLASTDEPSASRHNLRALLALERAQARGHLATPRDRFNLVALHLGLRQFDPAIALLEKGLADGSIENTRRNWELLANSYQQTLRVSQAVATLEKAVKALPDDGQLEFTLAQLHYAGARPADARVHLERAIAKGRLDHPGQARLFLAYIAYELQSFDEAARLISEASAFDDVKKKDLARLSKAIDEARSRPTRP